MTRTVGLALAAAVYPTLLAGVIVILGQPRPRRLLSGFLVGGMTISVLSGWLVLEAIRESNRIVQVEGTTRPLLSIVLGVLSLGAAITVWTGREPRFEFVRRRREQRAAAADDLHESWTQRVLGRGSVVFAVAAGVLLNLPGIWYLAALSDIAEVTPAASRLFQILVFNLIMFVLVEVPLLMYLFDEERARRLVIAMDAWIKSHMRQVAVAIAGIVGIYLVARGVVAFAD